MYHKLHPKILNTMNKLKMLTTEKLISSYMGKSTGLENQKIWWCQSYATDVRKAPSRVENALMTNVKVDG